VLKELVKATGVSLQIGLVAGAVATLIGLTLGLLGGYVGGFVDDIIMFITNLFTVIPGFVLLILISFSIGQDKRGAVTIAVVIGFTSWVWTGKSCSLASGVPAESRPCQPVETIRALDRSHHSRRYSALHRFLCCYGVYSADFLGYPGGSRVVDPWIGT